jgi:hypothetical protein
VSKRVGADKFVGFSSLIWQMSQKRPDEEGKGRSYAALPDLTRLLLAGFADHLHAASAEVTMFLGIGVYSFFALFLGAM